MILVLVLLAAVPFWFVHRQSVRVDAARKKRRIALLDGGTALDGGGVDCVSGDCGGDGGDGGGD